MSKRDERVAESGCLDSDKRGGRKMHLLQSPTSQGKREGEGRGERPFTRGLYPGLCSSLSKRGDVLWGPQRPLQYGIHTFEGEAGFPIDGGFRHRTESLLSIRRNVMEEKHLKLEVVDSTLRGGAAL